MSRSPTPINDGPELTAQVARAAFPHGNRYMQMREILGTRYADGHFAALSPTVGQPAEAPWRLARVTSRPCAENLTDRQAAEAVRGRIDWPYAFGWERTAAGVAVSALSEGRRRLIAGAAEEPVLTPLLAPVGERGRLKARGTQRPDSPPIVAAVRALNRLEIVGETLHHTLNVRAQRVPHG
jgi:transposase